MLKHKIWLEFGHAKFDDSRHEARCNEYLMSTQPTPPMDSFTKTSAQAHDSSLLRIWKCNEWYHRNCKG